MARGKTTSTAALREENEHLKNKLEKANKRADAVLAKVGGLRAHMQQNSPTNDDVIRILESIIQNS